MIELVDHVGRGPTGRLVDSNLKRIMLAGRFVGFLFPNDLVTTTVLLSESELSMLEVALSQEGRPVKMVTAAAQILEDKHNDEQTER